MKYKSNKLIETKDININEVITTFNEAVADYIEKKIDTKELEERVEKLSNTNVHELLARTGNSLVAVAMECVESLSYASVASYSNGTATKDKWLRRYYEEFRTGIPPYNTKLEFIYTWNAPNFQMEVKFNQPHNNNETVSGSISRKE